MTSRAVARFDSELDLPPHKSLLSRYRAAAAVRQAPASAGVRLSRAHADSVSLKPYA